MGHRTTETVTEGAPVYRVCAGAEGWYVIQEPGAVPVASFDDKAGALNYAMCLARGRVAWHLLLRQSSSSTATPAQVSGNTHH
jgi:hypothetical protein